MGSLEIKEEIMKEKLKTLIMCVVFWWSNLSHRLYKSGRLWLSRVQEVSQLLRPLFQMTINNKKDNMLRCVCCDNQLTISEMKLVQEDGSPEDMCGECRRQVVYTDQEDDEWSHEYMFENLREGVTGVLTCDY